MTLSAGATLKQRMSTVGRVVAVVCVWLHVASAFQLLLPTTLTTRRKQTPSPPPSPPTATATTQPITKHNQQYGRGSGCVVVGRLYLIPNVLPRRNEPQQRNQLQQLQQFQLSRGSTRTWFSSTKDSMEAGGGAAGAEGGGGADDDDNDDGGLDKTGDDAYDDLYEFLTRRKAGALGGSDADKRRKRDRIREWVSSASTTTTKRASVNMVKPINMEDGSVIEEPKDPPRIKANFGKLFSDMPSLGEILSSPDEAGTGIAGGTSEGLAPPPSSSSPSSSAPDSKEGENTKFPEVEEDDEWFDDDRKAIEGEYKQTLEDLQQQIKEERGEDPDTIPENAERVAEAIIREDMGSSIKSMRTSRMEEKIDDYTTSKLSEFKSRDSTDATDDLSKQILQEAADKWTREETLKAQKEDFLRYEDEVLRGRLETDIPEPGPDLDKWALERMEEMFKSNKDGEECYEVSDSLEENIEELKLSMEMESKKGSIEPQTMKEWQMYRSILTSLTSDEDSSDDEKNDVARSTPPVDERQILNQLDDWREYIKKEEEMRRRSGLSADPDNDEDDDDSDAKMSSKADETYKTQPQLRREINMQAIEVMEALLKKSAGPRGEALRREIEWMKADLESTNYLDVDDDEEPKEEEMLFPVDFSDVFNRSDGATGTSPQETSVASATESVPVEKAPSVGMNVERPPQAPDTPFFSDPPDSSANRDEALPSRQPPPPNTPFFSDGGGATSSGESSKLSSSYSEQALQNMFRKAGVASKEEQDAMRKEWEEFQEYEKAMRVEAGLAGNETASDPAEPTEMQYDLSDVLTEDGDFDASKILATIGPRPGVPEEEGSSESLPGSYGEGSEKTSLGLNVDDPSLGQATTIGDADDGEDSLSASGGQPDSGDLPDWLKEEREASEDSDEDRGSFLGADYDSYFDDDDDDEDEDDEDAYIDRVQQLRKFQQDYLGEKASTLGIDVLDVLGGSASDDYADYTFDTDYSEEEDRNGWGATSFEARKEILLDYIELSSKELNNLMDFRESVFTTGVSRYQSRINKPFKEFGAVFQLEGVLVDLTGLHQAAWTAVAESYGLKQQSLQNIKRAAVTQPEVTVRQIFRWSYDMSMVNDITASFREHFRNEFSRWAASQGLSYEVSKGDGIQQQQPQPQKQQRVTDLGSKDTLSNRIQAWKHAAAVHSFKEPTSDQVKTTEKMTSSEAVRQLLGWTYNFNSDQIKKIATTYENELKRLSSSSSSSSSSPRPQEGVKVAPGNVKYIGEEEIFQVTYDAWVEVAWRNGLSFPEPDQVHDAFSLGQEGAILKSFKWTDDKNKAAELANLYRGQVKLKMENLEKRGYTREKPKPTKQQEPEVPTVIEPVVVKSGIFEWISSLLNVGMGCGISSHLEEDQLEVVLQYARVAHLFPSAGRVFVESGYTRDSQQLLGVSLRIERRPDHCVVFTSSPTGNEAAAENEMKSISFVGAFPKFDLRRADTTALGFESVTAVNIRRLFGERVDDQPMADMWQNQPKESRKIKTAFWDDD